MKKFTVVTPDQWYDIQSEGYAIDTNGRLAFWNETGDKERPFHYVAVFAKWDNFVEVQNDGA
jgi:hypothetical protein